MNRRSFIGALGGVSATSFAGCANMELSGSSSSATEARQRALSLYEGGLVVASAGEHASATGTSITPTGTIPGRLFRATSLGRASGYFDAAAWNFTQAGQILSAQGLQGVEECSQARERAFHSGMGNLYLAWDLVESAGGYGDLGSPTSTIDGSGGLASARHPDDDSSATMKTPVDDDADAIPKTGLDSDDDADAIPKTGLDSDDDADAIPKTGLDSDGSAPIEGDTAAELATAHFSRAFQYEIVSIEQLRLTIELTDT